MTRLLRQLIQVELDFSKYCMFHVQEDIARMEIIKELTDDLGLDKALIVIVRPYKLVIIGDLTAKSDLTWWFTKANNKWKNRDIKIKELDLL